MLPLSWVKATLFGLVFARIHLSEYLFDLILVLLLGLKFKLFFGKLLLLFDDKFLDFLDLPLTLFNLFLFFSDSLAYLSLFLDLHGNLLLFISNPLMNLLLLIGMFLLILFQ